MDLRTFVPLVCLLVDLGVFSTVSESEDAPKIEVGGFATSFFFCVGVLAGVFLVLLLEGALVGVGFLMVTSISLSEVAELTESVEAARPRDFFLG